MTQLQPRVTPPHPHHPPRKDGDHPELLPDDDWAEVERGVAERKAKREATR